MIKNQEHGKDFTKENIEKWTVKLFKGVRTIYNNKCYVAEFHGISRRDYFYYKTDKETIQYAKAEVLFQFNLHKSTFELMLCQPCIKKGRHSKLKQDRVYLSGKYQLINIDSIIDICLPRHDWDSKDEKQYMYMDKNCSDLYFFAQ